jgi:hypothetical protein
LNKLEKWSHLDQFYLDCSLKMTFDLKLLSYLRTKSDKSVPKPKCKRCEYTITTEGHFGWENYMHALYIGSAPGQFLSFERLLLKQNEKKNLEQNSK